MEYRKINCIQKRIVEVFGSLQVLKQQESRGDKKVELLETLVSDHKTDKDLVSQRVDGKIT